jgi:hypothetical protein
MRSLFAALGYLVVFGTVVGIVWLRNPPVWTNGYKGPAQDHLFANADRVDSDFGHSVRLSLRH